MGRKILGVVGVCVLLNSATLFSQHCTKIVLHLALKDLNLARPEINDLSFGHSMSDLFFSRSASLIFSSFSTNQVYFCLIMLYIIGDVYYRVLSDRGCLL